MFGAEFEPVIAAVIVPIQEVPLITIQLIIHDVPVQLQPPLNLAVNCHAMSDLIKKFHNNQ